MRHSIVLLLLSILAVSMLTACVPLAEVDQGDVMDEPYRSDDPFDRRWFVPSPGDEDFFKYLKCRKFLDDTVRLRRQILIKHFEHFEAARKPETQAEAYEIETELRNLIDEFYIIAPPDCVNVFPY